MDVGEIGFNYVNLPHDGFCIIGDEHPDCIPRELVKLLTTFITDLNCLCIIS